MNIKFDKEVDIVYLRFLHAEIAESDEDKPAIITHCDKDGAVAGIEVLDASKKIQKPGSAFYKV